MMKSKYSQAILANLCQVAKLIVCFKDEVNTIIRELQITKWKV